MFWKRKTVDEGPPPKDPPPGDEDAVAYEDVDDDDPNIWLTKHPSTGKWKRIPIGNVHPVILVNHKRGVPFVINGAGGGDMKKQAMSLLGAAAIATLLAVGAAVYAAVQAGEDPREAAEKAAIETGGEKGKEAAEEMMDNKSSSTTSPSSSTASSIASSSSSGNVERPPQSANNPASPDSSTGTMPMMIASLPIMNAWPPLPSPANKVDISQANTRMDELQREKAEITKRQQDDAAQSAKLDKDIATLQARMRLQQRSQYLAGVSDNVRRNAAPIPTPITRYNDSSAASSAQSAAGSAAQAEASAQSAAGSAGSASSSAGSSSQSASQSLQSLLGALNATDNGFNTPAASPVVPQQ